MYKMSFPPIYAQLDDMIWKGWFQEVYAIQSLVIQPDPPITSDIPNNRWQVIKDLLTGDVKLYVNDGGTLKSVTLS